MDYEVVDDDSYELVDENDDVDHFLQGTEYFSTSTPRKSSNDSDDEDSVPEYSDDILDALLAQLDDDIGINGQTA